MANYRVKPGYCLHLPHGRFVHPGEEVELSGDLEQEVLEKQGWKVMPAPKPPKASEEPEPKGPKDKEVNAPPQDRAIKEPKTK